MTPDAFTIQELFLEVGDGHTLYVHEWGSKEAKLPVIVLHGGPGGSSSDKRKQAFDPARQRVIFFDQRGCGKSTPYGSLEHNTTDNLVRDISTIADHLAIEKFILHGSSWGSALAFYYGIAHPERVVAMVLGGIWTGSKTENDWLDAGGFRTFYPDAWEAYAASTPKHFHDDPSAYHFPRILGDNEQACKASGFAYETLESTVMSLDDRFTPDDFETFDPAGIRIEVQYLTNLCFMPDRYVFDNAATLTMPVYMVQGRQDMVCPPITAYALHEVLPRSELIWTTSGHRPERESWNITRTLLLQLSQVV